MKKFRSALLALLILPCALFFGACSVQTKYVSPTVTEEVVLTSDLTQATNLAMMSTVAIFAQTSGGYAAGAGVIYSLDQSSGEAYIITNYHVVSSGDYFSDAIASTIYAQPYGSQYCYVADNMFATELVTGNNLLTCEYVGGSQAYDIAVLRVEDSLLLELDVRAATIASSTPKLGSQVIAIGNPNFEGLSATRGIISVESEQIDVYVGNEENVPVSTNEVVSYRAIRFDAAINGGNSGGGLFNEKGELVGIPSASAEDLDDYSSAIPASVAVGVAQNIIDTRQSYNLSGVYLVDIGIEYSANNSKAVYDETTGLTYIKEDILVSTVSRSGLFAESGIKALDKITSIKCGDRELELSRAFELDDFLLTIRPGDTIELTWVNGDGAHTYSATTSRTNFGIVSVSRV